VKANSLTHLKLVLIMFLCIGNTLKAQTVAIETTRLAIVDKRLEIDYNFLKAKKNQRFEVWVEITNSQGIKIDAKTFSGDVGTNLLGGSGKKIIWDYNTDGLVMNDEVEVIINAKITTVTGAISGGKCFFQSIIIPGLGMSTVDKGKPYWLISVLGYGAVGTSIYLNSSSKTYYDKYKLSTDQTEATNYFNKSQSQKDMSKVFAYTAIGTWSISLIWTIIKVKQHNNSMATVNKRQRFSMYTSIEPYTKKPMLGIKYKF
jgi:hypothetical protein